MFRVIVILLMANVFTLVTPPLETTHAIQSLLKPLKLVGLPADEIAMIISVAIQFIPTLLQEADTVKKAQIARGARFESRKLHERAAAMLPLIVPIFLSLPWRWRLVGIGVKNTALTEKTALWLSVLILQYLSAAFCVQRR